MNTSHDELVAIAQRCREAYELACATVERAEKARDRAFIDWRLACEKAQA